jgi:hypothetical protein
VEILPGGDVATFNSFTQLWMIRTVVNQSEMKACAEIDQESKADVHTIHNGIQEKEFGGYFSDTSPDCNDMVYQDGKINCKILNVKTEKLLHDSNCANTPADFTKLNCNSQCVIAIANFLAKLAQFAEIQTVQFLYNSEL